LLFTEGVFNVKRKQAFLSILLSVAILVMTVPVSAETSDVTSRGLSEELCDLGYCGIGLTDKQIDEKREMADVLDNMSTCTEGKDYASDRISFMADSREEAERIASCYGATLTFFEYGYAGAVVDFSDEELLQSDMDGIESDIPTSIEDLVELAGNPDNNLPPIYPSYIYTVEVEETDSVKEADYEGQGNYTDTDELSHTDYEMTTQPSKLVASNEMYYKQWFHKYIESEAVWESGITGKGVVVAVIDTGIDLNSPDLKEQMTDYKCNMMAGDVFYTDIYENSNDASDDMGHGTHCAGIIAAANNSYGGVGVAYDAKIMPIKVLDFDGSGYNDIIAAGIVAATENGADILSMSLGGPASDPIYKDAIDKAIAAGKITIAAAGNDGTTNLSYPGAYDGVICVGSLSPVLDNDIADFSYTDEIVKSDDEDGEKVETWEPNSESSLYSAKYMDDYKKSDGAELAYYSTYNNRVSVVAPGSFVYSTFITKNKLQNYEGFEKGRPAETGSCCEYSSGTSMATPVVAGIAALVISADRSILSQSNPNAYMKELLIGTSDKREYTRDWRDVTHKSKNGVNAKDAVFAAKKSSVAVDEVSLSLANDRIGINFYFDNLEQYAGNGTFVSLNGDEHEVPGSYDKLTCFTQYVNAKNMSDKIEVKLYQKDESGNKTMLSLANNSAVDGVFRYSVMDYLDTIMIAGGSVYSKELMGLAFAMKHYGWCSEYYFSDGKAGMMPEVNAVDYSLLNCEGKTTGELPSGVTYAGSSLMLESNTSIRHYFNISNNSALDFRLDGENVRLNEKDGLYYIEINNIKPTELDKKHTLEIAETDFKLEYSALSYCKKVNSKSSNRALKSLADSIYWYNAAAKDYF